MVMVRTIKWKAPGKILRLDDGQTLSVSRSSCVGKGDELVQDKDGWLVTCRNGHSRLLPLYCTADKIKCGETIVPIDVKEIETEEEYEGFVHLRDFHYRGKALHGRTSALVAVTEQPLLPKVLGYIELATAFFMNKARYRILDAPFRNETISWEQWDRPTARKYTNLTVRIARCVVYPEFRGLGLGQLLVEHSFAFARDHWQVGCWKPYFIEIVADMLKFVPFAERAGMIFAGLTEGNLNRVAKDMRYLLKNRNRVKKGEIAKEDSVGIVDLQVSYLDKVIDILHQRKKRVEDFPALLNAAIANDSLDDLAVLQDILRFPKPTYMRGLTPDAQDFLLKRVATQKKQPSIAENGTEYNPNAYCRPLSRSVVIGGLNVAYRSAVARTKKTHAIQQAFGISPEEIITPVFQNFELVVPPRSIVLVCGASGSGKTCLLDLITNKGISLKKNEQIEYTCFLVPEEAVVGVFEPFDSEKPLIELVGGQDIGRALQVLNIAGLAEAFLYLKKFDELSHGQQYRAMIARMIDTGANLWIADEFCAALDEITANIVAHNVQHYAREAGATVIVGAPHYRTFIRSLMPDLVVQLTTAWEFRIYAGEEFMRELDTGNVGESQDD